MSFDLTERRSYIGGSEAYSACGFDTYKPMATLYFEKTGRVKVQEITTEEIEAGIIMEDVVAAQFHKRFGFPIFVDNSLKRHTSYPWMGAHIDRLIQTPEGITFLECKNTSWRHIQEWKGDDIPERVIFQVQHYMCIMKVEFCYVGACIGGQRFVYKRIEANQVIWDSLIALERDFWSMVTNRIEPELEQAMNDDPGLARRLFPRSDGENDVDLEEIQDCLVKEHEINLEVKSKMKDLQALRNKIRAKMQDNPQGHTKTHYVNYKHYDSWELDLARLKKELPNVVRKYTHKVPIRRLQIKSFIAAPEDDTIDLFDGSWAQLDPFTEKVFD
jgi:putative phage-type endonuclease